MGSVVQSRPTGAQGRRLRKTRAEPLAWTREKTPQARGGGLQVPSTRKSSLHSIMSKIMSATNERVSKDTGPGASRQESRLPRSSSAPARHRAEEPRRSGSVLL